MSLKFVLRLNATACTSIGLALLLWGAHVSAFFGNQYPQIIMPSGVFILAYGLWLYWVSHRTQPNLKELAVIVALDYGWTLVVIGLVSAGQVFIEPAGIRVAMLTALFTAVTGALEFRHYKLLAGKY